jgi:pectate lyase
LICALFAACSTGSETAVPVMAAGSGGITMSSGGLSGSTTYGGKSASGGVTGGTGQLATGGSVPSSNGGSAGVAAGSGGVAAEAGSAGLASSGGPSNGGSGNPSNRGGAGSGSGGIAAAGSGGSSAASGGSGMNSAGTSFEGDCPDALVGWASQAGDGVATTTGGGAIPPVRPSTAAELEQYASDGEPRVIEIASVFSVPRLSVASNKTLIGVGANARIDGGIRIRGSADVVISNVIVKNLRVNGRTTDVDGDAVQVYNAHHVWIDHVEIYDGVDANLDVVHGSNWVTVSWSKFHYTSAAPDPEHKYSTLIGHSDDNAEEDTGRLNVSLHHNWWAEGVTERMPRVRFGKVHSFNNLFASPGNNYCLRAGRSAALLIENNYFQGVSNPHEFNNDEDEQTAHITERNSVYSAVSGSQVRGGGGTPFSSAPYTLTLDPAAEVPARVQACAGPR